MVSHYQGSAVSTFNIGADSDSDESVDVPDSSDGEAQSEES